MTLAWACYTRRPGGTPALHTSVLHVTRLDLSRRPSCTAFTALRYIRSSTRMWLRFYNERMFGVVKRLFDIYGDDPVIFILHSVNVIDHAD